MRWVTFDCLGTLIDWHSGFASILRPYAGVEWIAEAEKPHRLYREVVVNSLLRAAAQMGMVMSESQARALPESWERLRVFPDVEPMASARVESAGEVAAAIASLP